MMLYLLVRTGVYDHGIYGVYSSFKAAKAAYARAKAQEPDDYHRFYIRGYVIDKDVKTIRTTTFLDYSCPESDADL